MTDHGPENGSSKAPSGDPQEILRAELLSATRALRRQLEYQRELGSDGVPPASRVSALAELQRLQKQSGGGSERRRKRRAQRKGSKQSSPPRNDERTSRPPQAPQGRAERKSADGQRDRSRTPSRSRQLEQQSRTPESGRKKKRQRRTRRPTTLGDFRKLAEAPKARDIASIPPDKRPPSLAAVRERLGPCTRCRLHEGRTNIVFGVGSENARLMLVGEGPGYHEDKQGEPFVGRAGQLLDRILAAMGLSRQEVYIANCVKCRPPNNRDPEPDEIATCTPFLFDQVIMTLGRFAAHTLLNVTTAITRMRGKWHSFRGVPVMPTLHPAYLLRNPSAKRAVWQDAQAVMDKLGLERR